MRIENEDERRFYEIESANNQWSLPELRRQFNTSLYERLVLSRNKKKVTELSRKGQIIAKPHDVLKDPYVLEFLGLKEDSFYSETDLETAIINKIEHFLLELGKDFLRGAAKKVHLRRRALPVDLVFYNRLLRCYVLVDLKIGRLTHQDLGQIQMYVNYYDRKVKRRMRIRRSGFSSVKRRTMPSLKSHCQRTTGRYSPENINCTCRLRLSCGTDERDFVITHFFNNYACQLQELIDIQEVFGLPGHSAPRSAIALRRASRRSPAGNERAVSRTAAGQPNARKVRKPLLWKKK